MRQPRHPSPIETELAWDVAHGQLRTSDAAKKLGHLPIAVGSRLLTVLRHHITTGKWKLERG